MANPRRRHSKARTAKRRAKYYSSLSQPQLAECPNCGTPKMLHRACPNCGQYRGREVVERSERV